MQAKRKEIIDDHRSFLNKRGISNDVIGSFNIHSGPGPSTLMPKAIVIPVHDVDDKYLFNKYRRCPSEGNVNPKYLFDTGGKISLYGVNYLIKYTKHIKPGKNDKDKTKLVITEGELDTLVCWSLGIPAVTSTAGAMSFREEWLELLDRFDVYICFDNDDAGYRGAIKLLDFIPHAKVVFIPGGNPKIKDISDFVGSGGDFETLMREAESFEILSDVKKRRDEIASKWGNNLFHRMFIEHKRQLEIAPVDITGKRDVHVYQGPNLSLIHISEPTRPY